MFLWSISSLRLRFVNFTGQQNGTDGEAHTDGDDLEDDTTGIDKKVPHPQVIGNVPDDSGTTEEEVVPTKFDFDEEAVIARKVLKNVITSSAKGTLPLNFDKTIDVLKNASCESVKASDMTEPEKSSKSKLLYFSPTEAEDDLQRTIFISNLPFDIDKEEVKQQFSKFGEVQSFVPVLHRVTKYVFNLISFYTYLYFVVVPCNLIVLVGRRPRGTGFLKFNTIDAADAAVSATNPTSSVGIFLKGRHLTVLKALDKKSAQDKELKKGKPNKCDQRNLYLAKVASNFSRVFKLCCFANEYSYI